MDLPGVEPGSPRCERDIVAVGPQARINWQSQPFFKNILSPKFTPLQTRRASPFSSAPDRSLDIFPPDGFFLLE